jgi:NTP pyrophosphatase (non-canonical NTP hydrolase)
LTAEVERFAAERDWQRFHSPKNLASALVVEAGELLEHFQWMTEAESSQLPDEQRMLIGEEIADVLLYLIQLSAALKIDPIAAAQAKVKTNAIKYPVERARGTRLKYDKL